MHETNERRLNKQQRRRRQRQRHRCPGRVSRQNCASVFTDARRARVCVCFLSHTHTHTLLLTLFLTLSTGINDTAMRASRALSKFYVALLLTATTTTTNTAIAPTAKKLSKNRPSRRRHGQGGLDPIRPCRKYGTPADRRDLFHSFSPSPKLIAVLMIYVRTSCAVRDIMT